MNTERRYFVRVEGTLERGGMLPDLRLPDGIPDCPPRLPYFSTVHEQAPQSEHARLCLDVHHLAPEDPLPIDSKLRFGVIPTSTIASIPGEFAGAQLEGVHEILTKVAFEYEKIIAPLVLELRRLRDQLAESYLGHSDNHLPTMDDVEATSTEQEAEEELDAIAAAPDLERAAAEALASAEAQKKDPHE